MTPLPKPSELLLLSPRPNTDPAFQELAERLQRLDPHLPIRMVRGDGRADPPPAPGAALLSGRYPEALDLLLRGPSWRWVHLTSSGSDGLEAWPPLPGNPRITTSPGVNAGSVAEWCLGALLYLARDFGFYESARGRREWSRRWAQELGGGTLLIVGAGAAGVRLARAAKALGLTVVGVSRTGAPLEGFDHVAPFAQLDELLPRATATVILLPLAPETQGAFGESRIRRLSPGSYLVVASRGGIVDEEALLRALEDGHLAGAALDVFATEPLPKESPLWEAPNLLLTPHVAGTSQRYMEHLAGVVERVWGELFR